MNTFGACACYCDYNPVKPSDPCSSWQSPKPLPKTGQVYCRATTNSNYLDDLKGLPLASVVSNSTEDQAGKHSDVPHYHQGPVRIVQGGTLRIAGEIVLDRSPVSLGESASVEKRNAGGDGGGNNPCNNRKRNNNSIVIEFFSIRNIKLHLGNASNSLGLLDSKPLSRKRRHRATLALGTNESSSRQESHVLYLVSKLLRIQQRQTKQINSIQLSTKSSDSQALHSILLPPPQHSTAKQVPS
mmetsp:Transcript_18300/g.26562  ORF Transcript_18300/g.26562 Transcript_18300/m.26562 type:complete len:242 (-) Transcript_18300:22-747(-)